MDRTPNARARHTLEMELRAIRNLRSVIGPEFADAVRLLNSREGKVLVTGIGKSGFIGQKIASTFTSLGHRAAFLHPVEAIHGDLGAVAPGDVILALSFTGESAEVIKLVRYLRKEFSVSVIALTKSRASTLGKLANLVLEVPVLDEGSPFGVAPMASTTATLVVGDMLASAITSPRHFKKDHFARLHPGGGLSLSLRTVKEVMATGHDIPLIRENRSFKDALPVMSKKFLGVVGVTTALGRLSGVITDGDVRRFLISNGYDATATVKAVMTRQPKSISALANLKEALELMERYRITSLFVIDRAKKPVGIVHIHDIVEGHIV